MTTLETRPVHCHKCDLLLGRVFPVTEDGPDGARRVVSFKFESAQDVLHILSATEAMCPVCRIPVSLRVY